MTGLTHNYLIQINRADSESYAFLADMLRDDDGLRSDRLSIVLLRAGEPASLGGGAAEYVVLTPLTTTDALTAAYGPWLTENRLVEASADELLCMPDLTREQREWLTAFSETWEIVQRAEDEARAAEPALLPFTVLLLLPEDIRGDQSCGADWITRVYVDVASVEDATGAAQDKAAPEYSDSIPEDFEPIAIYPGHLFDLHQS